MDGEGQSQRPHSRWHPLWRDQRGCTGTRSGHCHSGSARPKVLPWKWSDPSGHEARQSAAGKRLGRQGRGFRTCKSGERPRERDQRSAVRLYSGVLPGWTGGRCSCSELDGHLCVGPHGDRDACRGEVLGKRGRKRTDLQPDRSVPEDRPKHRIPRRPHHAAQEMPSRKERGGWWGWSRPPLHLSGCHRKQIPARPAWRSWHFGRQPKQQSVEHARPWDAYGSPADLEWCSAKRPPACGVHL